MMPSTINTFIAYAMGKVCSGQSVPLTPMCLILCSVLVLKKLGTELEQEFIDVIQWLSDEQHMQARHTCFLHCLTTNMWPNLSRLLAILVTCTACQSRGRHIFSTALWHMKCASLICELSINSCKTLICGRWWWSRTSGMR